jgi:hypothetical protein
VATGEGIGEGAALGAADGDAVAGDGVAGIDDGDVRPTASPSLGAKEPGGASVEPTTARERDIAIANAAMKIAGPTVR